MGPFELLKTIVDVLEDLQIPYLVTGAVASIAYGEPRLTNDIDIVADLKEDHVDHLVRAFPPDDFYIDEEVVRRVNIPTEELRDSVAEYEAKPKTRALSPRPIP